MAIVTLEADAAEQLLSLPARMKARVEGIFTRLENWPETSSGRGREWG